MMQFQVRICSFISTGLVRGSAQDWALQTGIALGKFLLPVDFCCWSLVNFGSKKQKIRFCERRKPVALCSSLVKKRKAAAFHCSQKRDICYLLSKTVNRQRKQPTVKRNVTKCNSTFICKMGCYSSLINWVKCLSSSTVLYALGGKIK